MLSLNANNTSENSADSKDLESKPGGLIVDTGTQLSSDDGVLVADEERRSGVVRLGVYWSYWTAVGRCLASLVLLSILLMQGGSTVVFSDYGYCSHTMWQGLCNDAVSICLSVHPSICFSLGRGAGVTQSSCQHLGCSSMGPQHGAQQQT